MGVGLACTGFGDLREGLGVEVYRFKPSTLNPKGLRGWGTRV